tara:strand:- start:206 stop:337 length:132 start_codon:yes stop_codon:yes gene_type:complete
MLAPYSKSLAIPKLSPLRGLRFEMFAASSALNLLSLALPIVML